MKIITEQKDLKIKNLYRTLMTAVIFIAASGVGYIFQYIGFPETNIVVVYLLTVLVTAWLARSLVFGIIASVLATFLFNYFFVEPIFDKKWESFLRWSKGKIRR